MCPRQGYIYPCNLREEFKDRADRPKRVHRLYKRHVCQLCWDISSDGRPTLRTPSNPCPGRVLPQQGVRKRLE
jgi:hypothetical protein